MRLVIKILRAVSYLGRCFLLVGFLLALVVSLHAKERDGWLFNVSKKTMARNDSPNYYMQDIDRDLILKATLKNTSMKDREAGKVQFTILIKRWGTETGSVEKYEGTVELPALKRAEETEIKTAQYHIGGHMHGTSKMHVDEMVGWRFVVTVGARTTEFMSSSSFLNLIRHTTKGS